MTDWRPEDYDRARSERLNKWRRKLETPAETRAAWTNMILGDHGFIRLAHLNLHRVDQSVWRSAQPWPHQIRRLARDGLKTVINLRGGQSYGSLPLEIAACEAAGVHFEIFVLRSRGLPTVRDLEAAGALFDRIAYPALFHCKSGADRAGLMSALYLILHEGKTVREAARQLSLRYGHVRQGKAGVLDALFEAYLQAHPDEAVSFMDWARADYDPNAITAAFRTTGIGELISDRLLKRE